MHSLQTFYSCRVFPIGVDYLVTGKVTIVIVLRQEVLKICAGKREHILQR